MRAVERGSWWAKVAVVEESGPAGVAAGVRMRARAAVRRATGLELLGAFACGCGVRVAGVALWGAQPVCVGSGVGGVSTRGAGAGPVTCHLGPAAS